MKKFNLQYFSEKKKKKRSHLELCDAHFDVINNNICQHRQNHSTYAHQEEQAGSQITLSVMKATFTNIIMHITFHKGPVFQTSI